MPRSNRRPVLGFHFVCAKDKDVVLDGKHFRTGIWAVAEKHVIVGIRLGAYVALHEARSKPSYRQGKIVGFEKKARPTKKIPNGIEFLVEPFDQPLEWVGDGTGEKGFKR